MKKVIERFDTGDTIDINDVGSIDLSDKYIIAYSPLWDTIMHLETCGIDELLLPRFRWVNVQKALFIPDRSSTYPSIKMLYMRQ